MSKTVQLFNLQQIDTQLDNAHARLQEIDTALKSDAALKKAGKDADRAQKASQLAQLDLKRAEEEVLAQQSKIDNNQKTLYSGSVTNPKELEDLQNEAAALQRFLAVLEDRQLEKMIAFEEAESVHQAAQATLESVTEQVAQQNVELTKEQTEIRSQAGALEIDREKAVSEIDEESLNIYLNLRQSRHGLAVAVVKGKVCSACGAALTAAHAQAVRSPNTIHTCSSCKRILYAN